MLTRAPEYDDLRRPWAARFRPARPAPIARCAGHSIAYPNFPRPALDDTAYHGVNTGLPHRLRATYDPEGVFG